MARMGVPNSFWYFFLRADKIRSRNQEETDPIKVHYKHLVREQNKKDELMFFNKGSSVNIINKTTKIFSFLLDNLPFQHSSLTVVH